jgi:hypothetical protein
VPTSGMSGVGLAAVAAGVVFVWSGIKGYSILLAAQNLVKGQKPSTGQATSLLSVNVARATQTASGPGIANPTAGTWTHAGLMDLWIKNGGNSAAANNAACHAIQESSGNASVTSSNPDGGTNVGLWQLDTRGVGAGHSIASLQNPNTNARLAIQGSKNGTDWSQWATPGC